MYTNLIKRFYKRGTLLLIFSQILTLSNFSQQTGFTRPPVTDKYDDYKKQVKKDPEKRMIELKTEIPSIVYDLRYATTNNFMHRLMYPAGTSLTFMRSIAVNALKNVQEELQLKGLGLKIFDAYRPYYVTVKFWELVKDDRYVANPAKGSGHNRGIAVDLTIINLKTGKELDMGTGFDNFSDTAHHTFTKLPEEILQNRILLKSVMEKYGFKAYNEEWWHYSWPESSMFEILDLDFKKLKNNYKSINSTIASKLIGP
ncbi:MAG TPA: M15 family metallopeptidase [Chitinophagaceae bacterium]|nr:M15 family metallopeptidase [Chitinophagaceae bacterium]